MFLAAEKVLGEAGMSFRSVLRTWIYLRQMEDYAEFNRARSAFFRSAGVTRRPASTGIQGAPFALDHSFCMSFYAAHSPLGLEVRPMSTPMMNEAFDYGSDFSRGMLVREVNKVALYVSGTASVAEDGRTFQAGNFDAQARRMLLNVSTLLAESGASFSDVVSAVTYLKRPSDAERLDRIFRERGIAGIPIALVQAEVCRPDLLCEMEAFAALPLDGISSRE